MNNAYQKWLAGEGCCNAHNFIHIETSDEIQTVEVVNIHGQKVISKGNVNTINVSSLPQGLYMVVINFKNKQEAHKIYRK